MLAQTLGVPARIRTALPWILAATVACSKPAPQQASTVPVTVALVQRGAAPRVITANGQIDPIETARVVAQVSGLVTEVTFREGDWVQQGQVLFRIDPRPYAAALAQAQAALARDRATATYAVRDAERLRELAVADYVTKADAESQSATAAAAMGTVAGDRAAISKAQFDLANTVVTAPISGRTGSVLVRRGNLVQANPSQALVVINRTDPILVQFSVPASVFSELQSAGRPKPLQVSVWPTDPGTAPGSTAPNSAATDSSLGLAPSTKPAAAATAQGTLSFVDNVVDTTTGMVLLKAQLANHNGRLWPGQFAFIALQLSVQQGALLVPSTAIELGQQPAVYVLPADGKPVRRPVTLGATVGKLVVVARGLSAGERVITDGMSNLRPGAVVRVVGVDSTTQIAMSSQ